MSTQQKSTGFYVRIAGQIRGPVDAAELKRLAAGGELSPTDDVSRDLENWTEAGQYTALRFGPRPAQLQPPAVNAPPVPIPQFKRRKSLEFFAFLYFICGVLMAAAAIVCAIGFLVALSTFTRNTASPIAFFLFSAIANFFGAITCFAISAVIEVYLENAENLHAIRHTLAQTSGGK